jgi:hypothetical protein
VLQAWKTPAWVSALFSGRDDTKVVAGGYGKLTMEPIEKGDANKQCKSITILGFESTPLIAVVESSALLPAGLTITITP